MDEKKCEVDGTIKVPNWELVGQDVYIIINNNISKQNLSRIFVEKLAMVGSIKTTVLYYCGSNKFYNVYRTKEECATAWLAAQGMTIGLEDHNEGV